MKIIFNENKEQNISFEALSFAYRQLFLNTKEGEVVLQDLLDKARVGVALNAENASELFYTEGMRSLFHYITSHLKNKSLDERSLEKGEYDPFKY